MDDPLLIVRDWDRLFENNRSRVVDDLRWVLTPNRHDGEGFCHMMASPDSAELFSAWNLMLQVASRCHPRGTLLQKNGLPHNSASLAMRTRGKESWFKKAIPFCINLQWIRAEKYERQEGVSQVTPDCQATDEERKKERIYISEVIQHLNNRAGTKFKDDSKATISLIRSRLAEGFTVEDCKAVIDRQTAKWLHDPKMVEFLRPETLFRATKFEGYLNGIAAKPQPSFGGVQ